MNSCPLQIAALCIALAWPAGAALAAPSTGAQLASACTACHGTNGDSQGEVPDLAGSDEDEFVEHMNDFKNDQYNNDNGEIRPPTIMNRIAPGYDADEIAALARYFASMPKPASKTGNDTPSR